jgi:hypothetical protein
MPDSSAGFLLSEDKRRYIGIKDTIQLTKACIHHAADDDPKTGVETCSMSNK